MYKTLKTFYGFVLKKRLMFVGFAVLILISAIAGSILPYFYKLFVDALPAFDTRVLFGIIYLYIGVSVSALLVDIASYFVGDIILFDAAIDARKTIFKKVLDLDFLFHSNKSTGSLISIFKRGDGAFFDLFHVIHHRIADVVISFFVMVYFFTKLNPTIGIVAVVSMVVTVILTRFLLGYNIKKRTEFNREEDKISGIITDNMINYETVKLFAQEKYEEQRLANAFNNWRSALWGFGNSFRLIDITIGTVINLGIFAILALSILAAIHQKIGVSDFVLIAAFTSSLFPRLWDLVWSSRDMARAYSDIQ